MQTTSVSLLDRLAHEGDNADWQRLVTIYRPFIKQVVGGYPALASQADDVAQEVMLVLMRELPVFQRQRIGSFRTWLRNITVNQLRMALRKYKRQPQSLGSSPKLEEQIEELADPMSRSSQERDFEHDRVVMERLLEFVKPSVQETTWLAFEKYALNDEQPADVASELGLSLNSVLLAKSRVLRRLRCEARGLVDE